MRGEASILLIYLFIYFDGEKQHYIPLRMKQGGGQKQLTAEVGVDGGGGVGGDHVTHELSSEQNPGREGGSCIINV